MLRLHFTTIEKPDAQITTGDSFVMVVENAAVLVLYRKSRLTLGASLLTVNFESSSKEPFYCIAKKLFHTAIGSIVLINRGDGPSAFVCLFVCLFIAGSKASLVV